MRYEYRVERTFPTTDGAGMTALLNALAAEGWELLCAVAITDTVPVIYLFFRRPLD